MSAETVLYAALNVAGVTAIVGAGIYPDARPQESVLPCIVYQRINTSPILSIGGALLAEEVTFQVAAVGKTRAQLETIGDAMVIAILAAKLTITDRASGYDTETDTYSVTITVLYQR